MKFNLKNRPEIRPLNMETILQWFEGFEKELREIYKEENKIELEEGLLGFSARKQLAKEILGE